MEEEEEEEEERWKVRVVTCCWALSTDRESASSSSLIREVRDTTSAYRRCTRERNGYHSNLVPCAHKEIVNMATWSRAHTERNGYHGNLVPCTH